MRRLHAPTFLPCMAAELRRCCISVGDGVLCTIDEATWYRPELRLDVVLLSVWSAGALDPWPLSLDVIEPADAVGCVHGVR